MHPQKASFGVRYLLKSDDEMTIKYLLFLPILPVVKRSLPKFQQRVFSVLIDLCEVQLSVFRRQCQESHAEIFKKHHCVSLRELCLDTNVLGIPVCTLASPGRRIISPAA